MFGHRASVRKAVYSNRKGIAAASRAVARRAAVQAVRAQSRVANVAMRGMQLDQGEFKSVDGTYSPGANTATAVQLLNGIARGDEINERTGREVVLRSIEIKGYCQSTLETGLDQEHRVMLVYDRQTNGAALTAAQVLAAVSVNSPRNLENRRRFKIMFDRTFYIAAATKQGCRRTFKFYRHLRHPVEFNAGDAGTVADITTGSLYFIVIGSQANDGTDGVVVYTSRVRYQDK